MWMQPHLVILDEPTNYLDRESLGALADAIREFEGGVVIISHNNDFTTALCPETWVVEKDEDEISRPNCQVRTQRHRATFNVCHASHMAPRRRRRGRPRAFDSDAVRIGPKLDTRPPATFSRHRSHARSAQGDPEWMKNALATKCDDQQAITEVTDAYGNVRTRACLLCRLARKRLTLAGH